MNSDLTPEIIEGIPKTDVIRVKNLADELHQGAIGVLETPLSAADIERELRLRSAMKIKLDEVMGWLSEQLADLEGIKRDLRTKKSYQTTDEARLESYMFTQIRSEKKGQS